MATPIGQPPHGYSAQIGPANSLQLPTDLKKIVEKLVDLLHRIREEAHHPHPSIVNLAEEFKQFDDQQTDLLSETSKKSDRALEAHVKNTFQTEFHHFAHNLKDIINDHDPHQTSFRDVLLSMPHKIPDFLEDLNKTSKGREDIHQIGDFAGIFAHQLTTHFHLH
jgi:hypothetical protein